MTHPAAATLARLARTLACVALVLLGWSSCALLPGGDDPKGWKLGFHGVEELDVDDLRSVVRGDLERFNAGAARRAAEREPIQDERDPLPPAVAAEIALEDAIWTLERVYRKLGFVQADVRGRLTDTTQGEIRARFDIVEGPRVEISKLNIRGNRALKSKQIEVFFDPEERGLFESKKNWYVESELSDGARKLGELYASLGYLDAVVSPPRTVFLQDEDGTRAEIAIEIVEGRRYVLGAVEFAGDMVGLERELEKLGRTGRGEPYSPGIPRTLRGRAEELLGRRGHADARVRLMREERRPDGTVALAFDVQPGPVVTLGDVRVHGNKHTDSDLIDDALDLKRGERYDSSHLRRASERLQGTGLFSTVRIDVVGEGDERAVDVALEELPRRELYLEPSYGSYERLRVKAGWRERNIFGGGRELDADGTLGELAQDLRLGLGDPRLLGSDARGDLAVFATRRKEPSFTKSEAGSSFTVSERLSRQLQGSATYSLRTSRSSDVDTSDPTITDEAGSVDISSIKLALLYDARDDPFAPRKGFFGRGTVEYAASALGSKLDFLRCTWSASQFTPLWEGAVVGGSWRAGLIVPLEDTSDIPLQERFFNGGENSVRSFHENEIGPRDANGEVIGGEASNTFTLELRQRLVGHLDGALFFDTGNVEPDYEEFFGFDGMERAVGIGVRYMLPVGPVRLDAGFNPWHDESEDSYVVHFSVGMSF